MNRRFFLKASALTAAPLVLNRLPIYAGSTVGDPMLKALTATAGLCDRVLVIVQLNGGNDGLNMVIPLDRYSDLDTTSVRSSLMIPSSSVLSLSGTTVTGLHPSLTGLQTLYNNGKLTIVQGVSYPTPNYSHFQAQDIWFTGDASLPTGNTGWLGAALDADYPGYPTGYPSVSDPDPLAIQIGGALPLSLQGPNINMGYNVPNPAALISVATATPAPAPASDYGTELTFLRMMKDQSNAYATRITTAYAAQPTLSTLYAASGNSLSDQLKVVARLIGGGLSTPVYIVNHSDSFDTHVSQVVSGATTTGSHANMLTKLSVAVQAFMNDLALMGKSYKVLGMTFSEFGRRVKANTSLGTDHGSAAPVMLFGDTVSGNIIGSNPTWTTAITASTQVPTQYDFRQIYTTIMQDWMCLSSTTADTILGGSFTKLSLFNTIALPLASVELSGGWNGTDAALSVKVTEPDAYTGLEMERSFNGGTDWHAAGMLSAPRGVREATLYHADRDARSRALDEVLYRVRATNAGGAETFSNTLMLRIASGEDRAARVFPNPVQGGRIHIEFIKPADSQVSIGIYDAGGSKLFTDERFPQGGRLTLQVPPEDFDKHTLYILKLRWAGRELIEKLTFE